MQYVVYYRVSTREQGESGLGLEAQKSMINHFMQPEDIAKEFTEVLSAKISPRERPALNEAIQYAKENGHGLAVAKVDRLSRVTEDALWVYKELGAMLYACDIPMQVGAAMDKFTLTIYMAIADRERELIGLRTRAALAEIKKKQDKGERRLNKKGKIAQPIGSPKNLTAEAQEKGMKARKQNALTNAAWVQAGEYARLLKKETKMVAFKNEKGEIVNERIRNLSLQDIADRLNKRGFTTRHGCQYKPATVQRLLAKFA